MAIDFKGCERFEKDCYKSGGTVAKKGGVVGGVVSETVFCHCKDPLTLPGKLYKIRMAK